MTIRSFREDAFDPKYTPVIEYEPVNTFNDPGTSEIPASPDHTHQAFDDGTPIDKYAETFSSFDANNPVKLYLAGNHCLIDGVLDASTTVFNHGDMLWRWTFAEEPLWIPGFTIGSQCAVFEEDLIGGTGALFQATIEASVFSSEVRIKCWASGADGNTDLLKLYVNGFSFRTDSLSTSEIYPPDGTLPFTWDGPDGAGWGVGVWSN